MRAAPSQIKKLIKIFISLCIILALLSIVDRTKLLEILSKVPLNTALILIFAYFAGQVLSAYKWWYIAKTSNVIAPLSKAIRSYLIGMFINCFGLGLVGGDVARGILLSANQDTKTRSIATVIADRAHGLAVLAGIGMVATLFFGSEVLDFTALCILVGVSASISIGWIIGPALLLRIIAPANRFRSKAEDVATAFPRDISTILYITVLALFLHFIQIGLHWFIGIGIGLSLSFSLWAVVVPFINILSSLPISWNGVGVREAGYVFFLSAHGVSNEQAIAIGALWLLASTVSSMIGGLIGMCTNDLQELRINIARKDVPGGKVPA